MIDDPHQVTVEVSLNAVVRDLMDVARVGLYPHMGEISRAEGVALMAALMAVVDRTVPNDLQQKDARVQLARLLIGALRD